MSIPRHLHQVWIGHNPIPERERRWCEMTKRLNPEWKYTLHGNEALEKYSSDPYLAELEDRMSPWAFISDRLRMLILRDEGGVYMDADCEPLRPLSMLNQIWDAKHVTFVSGFRSPDRPQVALHRGVNLVDNTVFGTAPKSRMIERILSLWRPGTVEIDGHWIGIEILRSVDFDTVMLNYRYVYAENATPESICLHDSHNLGSWVNQVTERRRQRVPI